MAMNPSQGEPAAPRREKFAIGANVMIAIVLAVAILGVVNAICSMKFYRHDIASSGNYGLSDRTKNILGGFKGDINISALYMPSEEDEKQRGYIQRLQDYCDELQRFSSNVKVSHVTSPMQRE